MVKTLQKPVITGLPAPRVKQFVGVAEVCDALGISRSTLDRQRREGRFPAPVQISKARVVWSVEAIEQHLATLATHLATHAKADPADLSPEEAADLAPRLAAIALSEQLGHPISPGQVVFGAKRPTSPLEIETLRAHATATAEGIFAGLAQHEAVVIAAWQFPALREALARAVGPVAAAQFRDPVKLRALALIVLERAEEDGRWPVRP